jgi:hypothetical protein
MTVTHLFPKDHLPPKELAAKQDEVWKLARQFLTPEHFAELLLDRSRGDLRDATSTRYLK